MRIVIDMQGVQTESRFRGIGRYTMSFVQAIVRNRGEHEIVLVLNGLFHETIEPIRLKFANLLPQENIRIWYAPGPIQERTDGNSLRRSIAELIREAFLLSLKPDIIHVTSFFEGYVDDAITSIGKFDADTPVSVSMYDLIPFINAEQYLESSNTYKQFYLNKIENLKQASLFLAISEFSRDEALQYLSIHPSLITNVSTAIEDFFKPLEIEPKVAQELYEKYALKKAFILYTGGADQRKNLPRLIKAYKLLPTSLRKRYQLVIAGKVPETNVFTLKRLAKNNGLTDSELLFTGYIPDVDLIRLYNLCALYVFPSWHEGFGLPALEAMACGAPVIASNCSSLPEVIGLDDALFDPFDEINIASKMEKALCDTGLIKKLKQHGIEQSRRFSWDSSAKKAILAFESASKHVRNQTDVHYTNWPTIANNFEQTYTNLINKISCLPTIASCTDELLKIVAKCIDRAKQQSLAFLRLKKLPPVLSWRIEGPFDSSYSLAIVNRELAKALVKAGHDVVLHSTEGPGDYQPNKQFLEKHPDIAQLYAKSDIINEMDVDLVSRNLYPPRVHDMRGRLNILHSYGWEESEFPSEWVESFNGSLQGITVMSEHVRKILIDSGVSVPISVSGLGVDHWTTIDPEPNFQLHNKTKKFRFLHVSSCFPRKGVEIMLNAYGNAFTSGDDVTLIIKTFSNPHNNVYSWLEKVRANYLDYPDVQIIESDLSDSELKALYEQCHVLVAPSKAEGFGLPMAEAMLSGLAVITTDWSGQTDFCNNENSWLIDYSFERAETHFSLFDSVWAIPDLDHLSASMREVYMASESEREMKIKVGQEFLNKHFCWSHVVERIELSARKWAISDNNITPKVGWVSTWNTRCGIASYSEHLVESLPTETIVYASKQQNTVGANLENNVRRCWEANGHDTLMELDARISTDNIDIVVIQFNYGFFDFTHLSEFIKKQTTHSRTVIVMLHATLDPKHLPEKKLIYLKEAFASCARLLVHSISDLNRLKSIGLTANVALFPHGIKEWGLAERPAIENDKEFIVASYGFFLPHKGLLELIMAVNLIKDKGHKIRLSMLNAEYPAPESFDHINEARKLIKNLGLQNIIEINSKYLPEAKSIELLSMADLVVFPYQQTAESSSAAVRSGLSTKKPVAVTPLPIFSDVDGIVHILPGMNSEAIAEGLIDIIKKIKDGEESFHKVQSKADEWRNSHDYRVLGRRLYGMMLGLVQENMQTK